MTTFKIIHTPTDQEVTPENLMNFLVESDLGTGWYRFFGDNEPRNQIWKEDDFSCFVVDQNGKPAIYLDPSLNNIQRVFLPSYFIEPRLIYFPERVFKTRMVEETDDQG